MSDITIPRELALALFSAGYETGQLDAKKGDRRNSNDDENEHGDDVNEVLAGYDGFNYCEHGVHLSSTCEECRAALCGEAVQIVDEGEVATCKTCSGTGHAGSVGAGCQDCHNTGEVTK
jgi:hypothetical protein